MSDTGSSKAPRQENKSSPAGAFWYFQIVFAVESRLTSPWQQSSCLSISSARIYMYKVPLGYSRDVFPWSFSSCWDEEDDRPTVAKPHNSQVPGFRHF